MRTGRNAPSPRGLTDACVPLVDIGDFLRGVPEGIERIAGEIGAAAEGHGSFQVIGHGVSRTFMQQVHLASRAFFDLPEFDKAIVEEPAPAAERGWAVLDVEGGVRAQKLDIGPPEVSADRYHSSVPAGDYFAPNLWPTEPPQLRDLWIRYYLTMAELSRQLMSICALALRLDVDFFEHEIDQQISVLRAIDLPAPLSSPVPRQLRSGATSDFGSLTIVHQDPGTVGLEVRHPTGNWHEVPWVDGGVVVAIGDLLAERTSGRWLSSTHRFVERPAPVDADTSGRPAPSTRVSLVFCHQPNYDAPLACLPSCLPRVGAPKFGTVSSGVHLARKLAQ